MKSLGTLLKSPARIEVMRALSSLDVPLGVRPLAVLAKTHPYATLQALRELVEEGVMEKCGTRTRPVYRLDDRSADVSRLRAVFQADRDLRMRADGESLSRRARALMEFNQKALGMLRTARESLNEPV